MKNIGRMEEWKIGRVAYIIIISIISISGYAQENSEISAQNSPVPKINSEKIAWNLMYPSNYKKAEKSKEIKSYEEILLRMKSGTTELSLLIKEFESLKPRHHSEK